MIARFFGIALMLLSLSGRMAHAADLPADSPMREAHGEGNVRATNQAENPSQNVVTHRAGTSDAKRSPRTEDQTQRVRELIYFFRTYRVWCCDEEWAETIRELATIGRGTYPSWSLNSTARIGMPRYGRWRSACARSATRGPSRH